jgi:hypothetical protein
MTSVTLDTGKVMRSVQIRVRIPRTFGLRIWLAAQVFRLGGWIAGCALIVETSSTPEG